jgi:putative membrane protein
VAFYVGFKNNGSYERLWEGRRIWGALVNLSRSWAVTTLDFINAEPVVHRELLYRHLAYLAALRVQLRRVSIWQNDHDAAHRVVPKVGDFKQHHLDTELGKFLPAAEVAEMVGKGNPATHILRRQSLRLRELADNAQIDHFQHIELMRIVQQLYDQQGAAERIKTFPFPRQYAYFSKVFVWLLILLLPLGLLNEFVKMGDCLVWLTVPFHVLISWVFYTMEVVGDSSENPFENAVNDVPLTAICRNVEIDLREMLGETDLPPRIKAVDNILL